MCRCVKIPRAAAGVIFSGLSVISRNELSRPRNPYLQMSPISVVGTEDSDYSIGTEGDFKDFSNFNIFQMFRSL